MKTVYEVRVKRQWSHNAHKIAGFFPTSEMLHQHIESWPGFIRENLSGCIPVEVEDDFKIVPPEHMQVDIAKAFYAWRDGDQVEDTPLLQRQAVKDDPWDDWDERATHVHEWRTYVTGDLRSIWKSFNVVQRIAIAENAQEIADREEWE